MKTPETVRLQPLRALRALGRLLRDPNDTEQVFEIIGALGARATRRKVRRLRAHEGGRALLAEQPSLMAALSSSAPEDFQPGTLGHAYHAFLRREGISTGGLVAVSDASTRALSDDALYLSQRLTHQHDLWHVLAGYEGDIVGETALLAFSFAQTRNPGIALMVATFYVLFGGRLKIRGLIRDAYRRGRRAKDLAAVRWEDTLHEPLSTLRRTLGVGEPPVYAPLRAGQLGPKGLLGPLPGHG